VRLLVVGLQADRELRTWVPAAEAAVGDPTGFRRVVAIEDQRQVAEVAAVDGERCEGVDERSFDQAKWGEAARVVRQ
jgi:hypothetical protein